ncbi:MAG TPA: sensor histidine kinase [Xanthobacteraceae bacterium]|nr:sensor histidine kinase [Xanthobacteraceae bacterium]
MPRVAGHRRTSQPEPPVREPGEEGFAAKLRRAWRFSGGIVFSSLTRRIVIVMVAGLVLLVVGILQLSQFRAGLIDARVQSLEVQGEIIANAIASAAAADSDYTFFDLERPLELQPGETFSPQDDGMAGYQFSINPERVGRVLHQLISPTKTRARIYDRNGSLILDSRDIFQRGEILRLDLGPPTGKKPNVFKRTWEAFKTWLNRGDLPLYRDLPPSAGKDYPEVAAALAGVRASSMVRVDEHGEVIVSVAVPVRSFHEVRGALLLSTRGGDINEAVEKERLAIIKVFLIATGVMVLVSVLLAGTIAGPMRKLADSAERVRRRIRSRVEIPDYTARRDEIGHLSGALREMTDALYRRIEAIESFAADVAHELKNPLTSLRSAVETLPLAKTPEARARLLAVINHDVQRLDRLISDISDASRLDAELQRYEMEPVDLTKLLTTVVTVQNEIRAEEGVKVTLAFEGGSPEAFTVPGNDSRIGQVINNLLDNARSFSPAGGTVRVTCRRLKDQVEIIVDDDGPGIRPDALEKIFERFYTDRPHQGFGQNSGLGLSISKQIVEAHGGRMWAENRYGVAPADDAARPVLGARFVVRLPAL